MRTSNMTPTQLFWETWTGNITNFINFPLFGFQQRKMICYLNVLFPSSSWMKIVSKSLSLQGWSLKLCRFQWHNSFTTDGSGFPLRGLLSFPLQPSSLLSAHWAWGSLLSVTFYWFWVLRFTPLSSFLNVGSAAVDLRTVRQSAGVCVCVCVCGLGYERKKGGRRMKDRGESSTWDTGREEADAG